MDLSVIIPARGAQHHIAACLRSVTRCPGETIDMECIVVSDDSEGETAAVVNRYIERDRRIRLVLMETDEAADARNIGIEAAAGRYILFLGAADRLCEDAWEQIEAAVLEEYADFVAFSYITTRESRRIRQKKPDGGGICNVPCESGKLKAQMLPIPDMVSTDEREARKLMYTNTVLGSCAGKLFKSRIIRDNNIFFRTEFLFDPGYGDPLPPAEREKAWDGLLGLMFAAEYFGHSESYLLTKAMLLYRAPGSGYGIDHYTVSDRMEMLRILYDFHCSAVERYNDSGLMEDMKSYFLKLLTKLFAVYVEEYWYRRDQVDAIYGRAIGHKFFARLLNEVDGQKIRPKIRRYEYRLLREGRPAKIRRYCALRTGSAARIRRYFR